MAASNDLLLPKTIFILVLGLYLVLVFSPVTYTKATYSSSFFFPFSKYIEDEYADRDFTAMNDDEDFEGELSTASESSEVRAVILCLMCMLYFLALMVGCHIIE